MDDFTIRTIGETLLGYAILAAGAIIFALSLICTINRENEPPLKSGDKVTYKKDTYEYTVSFVEGREITVFDPVEGDYLTLKRKHLTKINNPNT